MYVSSIKVENVRNLATATIDMNPGINIFYGQNAMGKTNLLESIYFCAMGRSHRTSTYRELICFEKKQAYITCNVSSDITNTAINATIEKEKKTITVDGIAIKKLVDLLGKLLVVIFSPEDLDLVIAGPGVRRKFLDINLCQLYPLYYYQLNRYHHILNQRNSLLKNIKRNNQTTETIFLWDDQLIECGIKIIDYRAQYIKYLGEVAKNFHKKITGNKEDLKVIYKPNTDPESYKKRMENALERDIYLGSTSIGIHKDDIAISVNNIDVRGYGSQGQKRSASLSLKLSGIEYIKEKGKNPVVLLDDVLSELDASRQKLLLKEIKGFQTILTCTGVEDIIAKIKGDNIDIVRYNVKDGVVVKEI